MEEEQDAERPWRRRGFVWTETRSLFEACVAQRELVFEPATRAFVVAEAEGDDRHLSFVPPLVQPVTIGRETPQRYLETLADALGLHLVLLIQAGATGVGLWRDDELLAHKALKKYVVRGRGRAQPAHLKTRGKSRYGSRLRLQNAERQLVETNEKLIVWRDEFGAFDRIDYSCPVRTWPELFRVAPPPPFERRGLPTRIPLHVHIPDFAEVQRIRRLLTRGSLTLPASWPQA